MVGRGKVGRDREGLIILNSSGGRWDWGLGWWKEYSIQFSNSFWLCTFSQYISFLWARNGLGHPVVIILWPDIPYLKGAAMSTTNPWQIGWLAFGDHEIGKTTLNLINKWLRRSSIGRANRRMLVRCWNTSVEQDNGKIQNGISSSKLSLALID